MKKMLHRSLALILSVLMMLSVAPAFAFAADEIESEPVLTPVISFEKESETTTQVVMILVLKENAFNCLDIQINTADCLTLTSIEVGNVFSLNASNINNGMISIATVDACVAPFDVAKYTYTKNDTHGVVAGDFSFDITACYVDAEDGTEIDVTSSAVVSAGIPAEHIHVPGGNWIMTVAPTCGAEGTLVRYCTECNEIADTTTVDKTEHKNTRPENKAPTCTEEGYNKIFCDDCKTYISEEILPATNHPNTKPDHKDPTCTEAGYDRVICADCGHEISKEEIPATNHPNTKPDHKDPTCTEAGYDRVVCADCGHEISKEEIPATGHKNKVEDHKDPTCTEEGYDRVICNDCGTEISKTVIPAAGHKVDHVDRKAPSCGVEGYVREVCACGHFITETILEALTHDYFDDIRAATCTEDGYRRKTCRYCQKTQSGTTIPATGHKWQAWQTIKEPTVSSEGIKRRICSNCGSDQEQSIPKLVVKATEVIMSTQEVTMNFKQTLRLFANVLPEDAAYSTEIIWESSDPSVATVDEEGQVYAAGVGTATITAKTANGISDTCTVTVNYSIIQWIIVYILFGWIWYI